MTPPLKFTIIALALLLLISPAFGLTEGDFFGNIIEYKSELTYGYMVFEIKNPTAIAYTLDASKLTYRLDASNRKWASVKYYADETITSKYNETSCTATKTGTEPNGTDIKETACTTKELSRQENVWSEFNGKSVTFNPYEKKKFKVYVTYPAELGKKAIDWIPQIKYGVSTFEKPEWAWFNTSWSYRRLLNVSASNLYQEWFVDLENITASCQTSNCSDVRITEGETKQISYQVIVNGTSKGIVMSKFSGRNQTSGRSYAYFITQNASATDYYVYYGASGVSDASTFLRIAEDDMKSYAAGQYIANLGGGTFRGGSVADCGSDDCRKNTIFYNSTISRNVLMNESFIDSFASFQFPFNMTNTTIRLERTQTAADTVIRARGQFGIATGYETRQNPNSASQDIFDRQDNAQVTAGAAISQGISNITLVINGTTIRAYQGTTLIVSGQDATVVQGDTFYWSTKGTQMQGIISYAVTNATVIPYAAGTIAVGNQEFGGNTVLNVSAFGPNGTALSGWSINITNATTSYAASGLSNPSLFTDATTPLGMSTVNVTSPNYDSVKFINVNITNSTVQQINATLYPMQYFLFNISGTLSTSWSLSLQNSTMSLSRTSSGTYINITLRSMPLGQVTAIANSFGTVTNTSTLYFGVNNVSSTYTFLSNASTVTINVYTEETMSPLNNVSVLFLNATSGYNVTGFNATITIPITVLPIGPNIIIGITYQTSIRYYLLTIQDNTSYVLNTFMPTTGANTIYLIQTLYIDTPVNGSRVIVQGFINGTYRTVSEGMTDPGGYVPVYATQNKYYNIIVTHPNYFLVTQFTLFSVISPIQIQLAPFSTITAPLGPQWTYYPSNLSVSWSPSSQYARVLVTVNTTIVDSISLLQFATFNVTRWNVTNTTQYHYINVTGSQSYTFSIPLNYTSRYTMQLCWMRNSSYQCDTRYYTTTNASNWFNAKDVEAGGGPSVMFFKMVGIFVAIALAAMLYPFLGAYVLFAIPLLFSIMFSMNIYTLNEMIMVGIVSIAALIGVTRQ